MPPGTADVDGERPPSSPVTRRRLVRDALTLAVLLVALRLLDPTLSARTLVVCALIWTAGWGFWAWWDHRAGRPR